LRKTVRFARLLSRDGRPGRVNSRVALYPDGRKSG
jgi:hypothetical protein